MKNQAMQEIIWIKYSAGRYNDSLDSSVINSIGSV